MFLHITMNGHFLGCMKELWVNHKPVDFTNAAHQQKVNPGCSLMQEEPVEDRVLADDEDEDSEEEEEEVDACANHQCRRGSKCVPKRHGEYACRCRPGWSGRFCEQGEPPRAQPGE